MFDRKHMLGRRELLRTGLALSAFPLFGCAARPPVGLVSTPSRRTTVRSTPLPWPDVTVERVTFPSAGVTLAGDLYIPSKISAPAPAVPILGPFAYVKEQSPAQYAARLAAQGFIALAFDCRGHGESGGAPRRFESPSLKTADTIAAIDYLASRPDVDRARIHALGICQGASTMLAVAADDARVRTLANVAGGYLLGGLNPWLRARIERGATAKTKLESTGEVDYLNDHRRRTKRRRTSGA